MEIKFWGTRGSTSTCSKNYLKYGGNTPCIEIRNKNNYIIFEAGHGLIDLGKEILNNRKKYSSNNIHIFLSHMHLDHIQGIPFFDPIWSEDFTIFFYGTNSYSENLEALINRQFSLNYSPIGTIDNLKAKFKFIETKNNNFNIDDIKIIPFKVPHTSISFGYKINNNLKTITYSSDCEFLNKIKEKKFIKTIKNSDAIIFDTYFLEKEYPSHKGWGHSTFNIACEICVNSNIKKIIPFHYNPDHNDNIIDNEIKRLKKIYNNKLEIIPSKENSSIII